jgi:hypothetical protein
MLNLGPNIPAAIVSFIQQCFVTNTYRKVVDETTSLIYKYTPVTSAIKLGTLVLVGAGGAALFVVEPSVCNYFQQIILQALPFLAESTTTALTNSTSMLNTTSTVIIATTAGNIISKMGVGFLGAWYGGALGWNLSEITIQEVTLRSKGYTNPAFTFSDDMIQNIIKFNQHLFPPLNINSIDSINSDDAQKLKSLLIYVREQIEVLRGKDDFKMKFYENALLKALHHSDLSELLNVMAYSISSKALWLKVAGQSAVFLGDIPESFDEKLKSHFNPSTQNIKTRKKKDWIINMSDTHSDENSDLSDHGKRKQPRSRSVDDLQNQTADSVLRSKPVVYLPLKRAAKMKAKGEKYPIDGKSGNKGAKTIPDHKREQVMSDLHISFINQEKEHELEMSLLPEQLKRLVIS